MEAAVEGYSTAAFVLSLSFSRLQISSPKPDGVVTSDKNRFTRPESGFSLATVLCGALLFASGASAQNTDFSIANDFRYGIGEQYQNEDVERKEYLENLFNGRINISNNLGNLLLGFRVQLDRPREFGPDTVGLTQYFAEIKKDGLTARGGTFYHLVGRGLVFNTFESRPVGFNTLTEGVNIDYKRKEFKAGVYGGTMAYADILGTDRVEQYLLRGAWGEGSPIDEITFGASYLAATGEKTRSGFRNEFDAYLREGYIEGNYEGFSALFNWADKRTALDSLTKAFSSSTNYGTGWYGKLGYTGDLFGLTAEYKDYRFDLVEPTDRDVSTRPTRALPFQNAPTLVPEHDKTLLARNPHTIDFSDEVGFQLSGLVFPSEDLIVSFLATAASRHAAYNPVVVTDTTGLQSLEYQLVDDKRLAFPELSNSRYSPYWEIFAQAEYQYSDDISFVFGLQRKDNVIYYDKLSVEVPASNETYKTAGGVVESTINLWQGNSLHAILEGQRVFDSKKVSERNDSLGIKESDGHFFNTLLTLEFTRSPRWSANVRVEWSSTDKEQGGRQVWPVVGGAYRIGRSHTIRAQYGWERGGVVCTGGVCRFINPFTGFRLDISSKL